MQGQFTNCPRFRRPICANVFTAETKLRSPENRCNFFSCEALTERLRGDRVNMYASGCKCLLLCPGEEADR